VLHYVMSKITRNNSPAGKNVRQQSTHAPNTVTISSTHNLGELKNMSAYCVNWTKVKLKGAS
jgi:hypothetical protein